ncbi:MAG: acetylxylan esterase [Bacteroidales bacterium]|nr:acetylxylan esterase [Bacteroidales bacterium]
MKRVYQCLSAAAVFLSLIAGCKPANTDKPEEEIVEPSPLTQTVIVNGDMIWEKRPVITIHVVNPNDKAIDAEIKTEFSTDTKEPVTKVTSTVQIPANGEKDIDITTDKDLYPGFYKAVTTVNGERALLQLKSSKTSSVVFGISPEDILSPPERMPDFNSFWEDAKAQLAAIDMKAELTEIKSHSSASRKVYLVEMQSVPDGLEGEPVTVRGYYLEPQDGKKHPVIVHFFGYDSQKPSKLSCPTGGSSQEWAELYFSNRGQMINNRPASLRAEDGKGDFVNIYGDWFAYNFGKKDSYYYRGAYMDCVQAVRFLATRPECDMNNVFAEGSSQGGAFSYACAALSDIKLRAIAPCVAFMGDFRDYFEIVTWPGDTARKNKGSMDDSAMFAFLSYFDTKNLATLISCPVIACSGLQDGTCPPHTNIAPYNNLLSTNKQYYFYPTMQHEIPGDWQSKWVKFFKSCME